MKILLGILLLLFSIPVCYSQVPPNDTVPLNKLTPDGLLLDKGWKFHPGDDSAWAKPDYNDRDWQPINPSLDIRHIPQIKSVPVFWLRLKLLVDSTLMDQPLGITLSQVGASEIYLDGKLIYKFGIVRGDINQEHTHYLINRPFSIKLSSNKIQSIAVRYSYNPKGLFIKYGVDNYCFHLELNTVDLTFSKSQKKTRTTFIRELTVSALRMMLGFICFGLFFSFRSQRAYLYVGIRNFLQVCGGILLELISREQTNTTLVCTILFIALAINELSSLFLLNAVHLLYDRKKTWYYSALILFALFALLSFFFIYNLGEILYGCFYLLYSFEVARLNFIAVRKGRPGAIILFVSSVLFFIFIGCTLIAVIFDSLNTAYLFVFIAIMLDPFAWALFMAGEYARTGIALQARVRDVELLSQKAIAQEQEKQQLLASQNETLENRVVERTAQLNQSLKDLQSTQAQLIQSEKMASLGELTAGIAHEIQNPLNFVNNFSEVNAELIAELKNEIDAGNKLEILSIADNLNENEKKIIFHGKRADAIVKGMLQHSRVGIGHKEQTDLNRLVDEYLRLSYQGLRTRDSSFNSKIETDFDREINSINIIPPDIGRVLLNLFNNAFYALTEKRKQQLEGYQPTMSVNTKKTNQGVEIRVKDNGNGIPRKIMDKIFQPFFTTKPTGQGTGLGLSISYDIIKAHGGEIRVDSKEAEFTEFVVQIPIQ